jgi:hypothetical protein
MGVGALRRRRLLSEYNAEVADAANRLSFSQRTALAAWRRDNPGKLTIDWPGWETIIGRGRPD